MNCTDFYKKSYAYLLDAAKRHDISENELEKYFTPANEDYLKWLRDIFHIKFVNADDIRFIYFSLLNSLQDSAYRNYVKLPEQCPAFVRVLFGFQPKHTAEYYENSEDLFKAADKDGGFGINEKNRDEWKKFFRGVLDGANFLKDYKDREALQKMLNGKTTTKNDLDKKLAMVGHVEKKVFFMGDALGANFLREIGLVDLGKPDVHIKGVLKAVFPTISKASAENIPAKLIHQKLDEISKATGVTAYQVDRIIWLICTENFYLHRGELSKRDVFIKSILT